MRPRTCYGARDLTDGRKEETDAPSATAETFISLPKGKKIPVADAIDANVNDRVWIGGDAAPAGLGTLHPLQLRRVNADAKCHI